MLVRDDRGVIIGATQTPLIEAPSRDFMVEYIDAVAKDWQNAWKGQEHRYGNDFAAFLGERVLTDFDLRENFMESEVRDDASRRDR